MRRTNQRIYTKSLHYSSVYDTIVIEVCHWCKMQHSRHFNQTPKVACPHCHQVPRKPRKAA